MKIKSGFVLRNAMGDHIVMPAGDQIGKYEGAIVLNNVGAFIWEQLEEGISREKLVDRLTDEYDVSREEAAEDVDNFLTTLDGYGVLDEE